MFGNRIISPSSHQPLLSLTLTNLKWLSPPLALYPFMLPAVATRRRPQLLGESLGVCVCVCVCCRRTSNDQTTHRSV